MDDDILPFQHKPEKKLNFKERVKAGLQSGRINPISDRKKQQLALYRKEIQNEVEQPCIKCGSRFMLSRHHFRGQKYITDYIILCQICHDGIHANPNKAMEEGYLWPEYRGLQPNPNQIIPWS